MPVSAGDGWYPDPDVDGNREWSVGRHVRIMCDEGGVPLWDENGRLPEEPEFLTDFLGLSATLIADLTAWAEEERKLQRGDRAASHLARGRSLLKRVRKEIRHDVSVELVQ